MKRTGQRIAVIGAGPMGLGVAYYLGKQGLPVTIYEAGDRTGGMSASFDFEGLRLERYFHFLCTTDVDYFELLQELGIEEELNWVKTRMGYFYNGKMYKWGDPISLLLFPGLSLLEKVRYALNVVRCKRLNNFDALDKKSAIAWLKEQLGDKAYQVLWHRLMALKFHEWQHLPSAAWIAARIQRVAESRSSLFSEKTGYVKGCTEVLISAMEQAVRQQGSILELSQPVTQVLVEDNRIKGIKIGEHVEEYDVVISTAPLPYVSKMVPGLPAADHEKLNKLKSVAVVCLVLKLDRQFSPYFWLNINSPQIEIPGIIEYTNLNPMTGTDHVLYIPYYMPPTQAKYSWSKEQFYAEVSAILKAIRPDFQDSWITGFHASRYQHAQPVCEPNFLAQLPPIQSQLDGFFMADTSYYYPQDRSITESLKMAKRLAAYGAEWFLGQTYKHRSENLPRPKMASLVETQSV
jgi:protoporphyrinogen oxidase